MALCYVVLLPTGEVLGGSPRTVSLDRIDRLGDRLDRLLAALADEVRDGRTVRIIGVETWC